MESFVGIKKKIDRYEEEIEALKRKISKEDECMSAGITGLMMKTKFMVANFGGYSHEYFFCSSVSTEEPWCINGIRITADKEVKIGKLNISGLRNARSYDSITPWMFFTILDTTTGQIECSDSPLVKECLLHKPKNIDGKQGDKEAVAYCRLSQGGSKNGYSRQVMSIKNRTVPGYNISEYFKETISGKTSLQERTAVKDMIDYGKARGIKTMFVSELNRIGRSKDSIMNGIKFLRKHGFEEIYLLHEGILINEDYLLNGGYNQLSRMAKKSEDDLNAIMYRMKSGYDAYVQKAKSGEIELKLGRSSEYRKPVEKYREDYAKELDLIASGFSLRKVSTITGASLGTLVKLKKMFGKELEMRRNEQN